MGNLTCLCACFQSSIGKKQIVAATGLCLILFLIGHLFGNLFIFGGPEAFNHYAEKLANLRPGLFVVEAGLAVIFCVHIYLTLLLVRENLRARPVRYQVDRSSEQRSLSTRLMPVTGGIIFVFLAWHLLDFTFSDHQGTRAWVGGEDLGLYGVVYNSFKNPWHSLFYIVAMIAVGFHLNHAVESVAQTFGCSEKVMRMVKTVSRIVSFGVGTAFSAIPLYVLLTC